MIAEISAVLGTLNAVNGAISTLRETKSNVDSLSRVFGRVTTAASSIAEVEAKAKSGKITLSQKDAMEIAMAKKRLADYDRQLKDIFLMTGNMQTYEEMKRLQATSVAAAKKRAARAKAQKNANKQEFVLYTKAIAISLLLVLVSIPLLVWFLR